MKIEKIDIKKLKHANYNPRKKLTKNDREYQKIEKSIKEFGYVDPIIVNKDYTIIGGHQRHTVLTDLEFTDVECVVLDVDKKKEKALNIALNKISGEWDNTILKDLLEELDTGDFDMELTGFDEDELEDLLTNYGVDEEVEEDNFDVDEAIENIEEPTAKRGQIYKLGEWIYCKKCNKKHYIN